MPYGVEAICPSKHLRKENGENASVEETLDFMVIEFNKDAKKIVVSHSKTHDGSEVTSAKKTTKKGSKTAVNSLNQSNEKSTLGDLDALVELKEKMNKGK